MTTLPVNLALVAEDLARATMQDASRSRRRRRLVTYSVAFALLALTTTAAVASGWLFGNETPVIRVAPALGAGATIGPNAGSAFQEVTKAEALHRAEKPTSPAAPPLGQASSGAPRTLMSGLGSDDRVLAAVPTTSGGVCISLTGLGEQCVPTFAEAQDVVWFSRVVAGTRTTVVWGILRDVVAGVDVISAGSGATAARVANGAFYAELTGTSPSRLVLHLEDGSTQSVDAPTCPPTTPDCTP